MENLNIAVESGFKKIQKERAWLIVSAMSLILGGAMWLCRFEGGEYQDATGPVYFGSVDMDDIGLRIDSSTNEFDIQLGAGNADSNFSSRITVYSGLGHQGRDLGIEIKVGKNLNDAGAIPNFETSWSSGK